MTPEGQVVPFSHHQKEVHLPSSQVGQPREGEAPRRNPYIRISPMETRSVLERNENLYSRNAPYLETTSPKSKDLSSLLDQGVMLSI